MKSLKNILVGFLISFLGSIPLGYLNLVGLEIYTKSGLHDLVFFLSGVTVIESLVIYFTLLFAKQLLNNKKIMKMIDFFAVGFLFVLAFVFYFNFNSTTQSADTFQNYLIYSPFVIGIVLNCFNFLQLPFWASWNLYLLNGKYIEADRNLKYYYVAGTLAGVFLGMLSLIVVLHTFFQKTNQFSSLIIPVFIPCFFILLAGIQIYKVYKKYFRA